MNENEEVKIEEKIPQGVEEQENVVKDDVYRLIEMCDEMKKSIDNLAKVKKEQEYLIEVLAKLKDEKLNPLVSELTRQLSALKAQSETLTKRATAVEAICDECEKDEKTRKIVNDVLYSLGVFPQQ